MMMRLGTKLDGRRIRLGALAFLLALAALPGPGRAQGGTGRSMITPDNIDKLVEIAHIEVIPNGAQGVSSVAINPDDSLIGLGLRDGTSRLWSLIEGKEVAVLRRHESAVNAVAFTRDGAELVSASNDRTIRRLSTFTRQEVPDSVMGPALAAVTCLAFSLNGEWMATGSIDNLVSLWEATSGDRQKVFNGHQGAVLSVAFSPDSAILASAGVDKSVRLWDVETREPLVTLTGARNQIVALAFSPARDLIAAGDRAFPRSTVYLWDAFTGELKAELNQISGNLASLTFSPDGSLLAVGAGNGTVEVWDVYSGQRLATFQAPGAYPEQLVTSVTFSEDGTLLAWISGPNAVSVMAVGVE